jgi:hypothetical protein
MKRFFLLLLLSSFLFAQEENGQLWKDSTRDLQKALELEEEKATLPKSKWIRRDRQDADDDINKILNDVLEILEVTRLTELRGSYLNLGERISSRQREIRELRERSLSAPEDTAPLEFYKKTRDDLLEDIEAREKDISELENQQGDIVSEMRKEFAEIGVDLNDDQVRFYLGTVSGQDILSLSAVFQNVRVLNAQLEQLMKDSPGDTEAARRYYGMHVVLIRAMLQGHEMTLDRIDQGYMERLKELDDENDALRKETRSMLKYAEDSEKPLLAASLRTQGATAEAIRLYRQHLRDVRDNVYEGQKALNRRYDVALNAFHTIRVSAMLVREMESALQDLDALRSMQLPELIPINDAAIQQKFMDIGNELRAK